MARRVPYVAGVLELIMIQYRGGVAESEHANNDIIFIRRSKCMQVRRIVVFRGQATHRRKTQLTIVSS